MNRKTTDMEDIARQLGVSKTTVHYALCNTGRVSEAMRRRVLAKAEEMGYRPNQMARSLRSQRSSTLGVVVTSLTGSFYAHVLEGINGVAQRHKHGILLACSYGDPVQEREMIELLLEKAVDGLIAVPAHPDENRDYYRGLVEEGVNLVFVDRSVSGLHADLVAADNLWGGYLATRHMIQLGRKKVVVIAMTPREYAIPSFQGRLIGCNRALQEAGLEPAVVLEKDVNDPSAGEEFAYAVMQEYLRQGRNGVDALFAVTDSRAYGAIEALLEAGLRVPEDVSIVGFDDQDASAYFHPPLTTVRQPMREIGEEAARLLFRRLEEGENQLPRQRLSLEPTLIIRKSCGAGRLAPISDTAVVLDRQRSGFLSGKRGD